MNPEPPFTPAWFLWRSACIEAAIAVNRGPLRSLAERPPVRPTSAEWATVQHAVARAESLGLRLPATLPFRFVDRRATTDQRGDTRTLPDGSVEITLLAGLPRRQLLHVLYHELKHSNQHLAGAALSVEQAEMQAETFAAEAMAGEAMAA